MKKLLLFLLCIAVMRATFAEGRVSLNLDASKYEPAQVQLLKLMYEREQLQYKGNYMITGKLKDLRGKGIVKLVPDYFTVTFELRTNASKFSLRDTKEAKLKAMQENSKAMGEFINYLVTEIGVKPENIVTSQYSVETGRSTAREEAEVVYGLDVKFEPTANIGAVYKKIEPTDISIKKGIQYDVSEERKQEAKLLAYEYAIKNIMAQAKTIVKNAGLELGDMESFGIYKSDVRIVPKYNYEYAEYEGDGVEPSNVATVVKETVVYKDSGGPRVETVPIAVSKEMEISEEVWATFDLVKKVER